MNCVYFACPKHKYYTDAGYRWAAIHLEEAGVVSLGEEVIVSKVLGNNPYWEPSEGERNNWLINEIFPTVREFLSVHEKDGILYVDEEYIFDQWELGYDWKEIKPTPNG